MEITQNFWKHDFQWNVRLNFFQKLKYFFSIRVSHTVVLLSLLHLKLEKHFRKGYR